MRHLLISLILLFSMGILAVAQKNVAINTDGSAPDSSAILDIKSGTKGVLIPRMNYIQRNILVRPATGLLVFQSDDYSSSDLSGFYYNAGTPSQPDWRRIGGREKQEQVYLSDASFVVPPGITRISFEAVGGGGGRGGRTDKDLASSLFYFGGTGGGGAYAKGYLNVQPGQTINIVIGLGGANGNDGGVNTDGLVGGNTSIAVDATNAITVRGGFPGLKGTVPLSGLGGEWRHFFLQ